MNESNAVAPVRSAAFVFAFITVLLDMLARATGRRLLWRPAALRWPEAQ